MFCSIHFSLWEMWVVGVIRTIISSTTVLDWHNWSKIRKAGQELELSDERIKSLHEFLTRMVMNAFVSRYDDFRIFCWSLHLFLHIACVVRTSVIAPAFCEKRKLRFFFFLLKTIVLGYILINKSFLLIVPYSIHAYIYEPIYYNKALDFR